MTGNSEYSKKVIKRFLHPKNMGVIKNADAIGEVGNMKCGDVMKVYLKIKDNKIKNIKFQTLGCVAAIASTDAVCDLAKGKTLSQAKKISKQEILKKLGGLPGIKIHCSILGEEAIRDAIKNYENKLNYNKHL
jgi:nitrogen fixation NifU-like protein